MASLFDHVSVLVSDFEASKAFYLRALAPLGATWVAGPGRSGGFTRAETDFWIAERAADARGPGLAASITPVHVAFQARDRAEVDAFHRAALEAGGRDHGAPGLRPQYHANYYGAFVLDPDGHNVEAVCHGEPASRRTAGGDPGLFVVADADSPVRLWLLGARVVDALEKATLVVVDARHAATLAVERRARALGLPVVASWPASDPVGALAGFVAEAYAGDGPSLRRAVAHVAASDPDDRTRGPLRVTWLGGFGECPGAGAPPVGTAVDVGAGLDIGGASDVEFRVPSPSMARRHVRVVPTLGGVEVIDLGSTHGTRVDGESVRRRRVVPGGEFAVSGTLRFRVDGTPPISPG